MARRTVQVPVRGCDVGGWTDTWFAGTGRVCSLALGPGVTVTAERTQGSTTFELPDTGERFAVEDAPARHRLLVEALAEAGAAEGVHLHVQVRASVPPATSLGTSAAVCVGVIAAADAALHGTIRPAAELAAAAHRAEAVRVGRQSGVQDQLAAAHGGVNRIEVDYPAGRVSPIPLTTAVRMALDERLVHIAYGGAHDSSAVHEQVIAELEAEGPSSGRLHRLADLATEAARALSAGDLQAWASTLSAATELQRSLHPGLLSADADALIDLARTAGALGWKVNGAGGAGGSLSVLCPDRAAACRVADAARDHGHLPLDLHLAERGAHLVA